jgi:hypothetical protein
MSANPDYVLTHERKTISQKVLENGMQLELETSNRSQYTIWLTTGDSIAEVVSCTHQSLHATDSKFVYGKV